MNVLCVFLKIFIQTQFQVKFDMDRARMNKSWNLIRSSLNSGKSVFLLMNHVSKLDGLLMAMLAPVDITAKCKTYMNIRLFQAFLTGRIWKLVGHLPVHFKSDEHGVFKVDREKQAVVSKKLRGFMETGKILIFCPEGQINKNPRNLQPFRRGSFALPAELGMDIWALTTQNCDGIWPRKAGMGGRPGSIKVALKKIHNGKVNGKMDADDIKEECKVLAEKCQQSMQQEVSKLYLEASS